MADIERSAQRPAAAPADHHHHTPLSAPYVPTGHELDLAQQRVQRLQSQVAKFDNYKADDYDVDESDLHRCCCPGREAG